MNEVENFRNKRNTKIVKYLWKTGFSASRIICGWHGLTLIQGGLFVFILSRRRFNGKKDYRRRNSVISIYSNSHYWDSLRRFRRVIDKMSFIYICLVSLSREKKGNWKFAMMSSTTGGSTKINAENVESIRIAKWSLAYTSGAPCDKESR